MSQTAALYGFGFTRAFTAAGLDFRPITSDYLASKELARDPNTLHLTGTVSAPKLSKSILFKLAGVLSFIEHLNVETSEPVEDGQGEVSVEDAFETALTARRHNGGGAVVGEDAFNPWRASRQMFIEKAMTHLEDEDFCKRTRFNSLLFKCVETFRQRSPFVDITYFLLISGLEAFCRASQSDYKSDAAPVVTRQLQAFGFEVFQDQPQALPRAISTYFRLRNALFHQGDFEATVRLNENDVTLNISEYLFNLSMLISLTVMKAIGFDDGHTNWDCWIDRQLHK